MNAREQRGLVIAAVTKLNRKGTEWFVPSQTDGERNYRVDPVRNTCTCKDCSEGGFKCKHQFAVEFTIKRELGNDGSVTEMRQLTLTEKIVYKQGWPAYNAAQEREQDRIQEMLADLCQQLDEPQPRASGHPAHFVRDVVFALVYKVYSTFSSRRFCSDMRQAVDRGYMSRALPFAKINKYMRDARFTDLLKELIARSAAPLKSVETQFAIDSSGFGTCKFEKWFDHKYGRERMKSVWVKVHLSCGVKTNIVTAIRILDKDAADSPQFAPLVTETSRTFSIGEISADKAYTSLENFEHVAGMGGIAYLPFKSNHTGAKGGLFEKMFHYFKFQHEKYMSHYHLRSNVESTFSMIKRKFGDSVRSKDDTGMVNEVLCKVLAHNLCVLNLAECELGIDSMFGSVDGKPQLALMA